MLLTVAALAVAVVGMTMNGWFSRSLGSTDTAGWLFLTIGVVADWSPSSSPPVPPAFGRPDSGPRRWPDGRCG